MFIERIRSRLDHYVEVVRKTRQWVYKNWIRIVREPDIQAHYKAPYFWAVLGDMKMAGKHCRLFAERFLRSDGDFMMDENSKGFKEFPCTLVNQYIYSNGWIVSGMQKLGAYDISIRGMQFILRFQDRIHGGFYHIRTIPERNLSTQA